MTFRGLVALTVLGITVVIRPLAFASPPDQTWLQGWYDDNDFDDVILLLTGASSAITSHGVCDLAPVAVLGPIVEAKESSPPGQLLSFHGSRAPPSELTARSA